VERFAGLDLSQGYLLTFRARAAHGWHGRETQSDKSAWLLAPFPELFSPEVF
jgi:hypothetical protein